MPHLVILYTANLNFPTEEGGDMSGLCRALADTMIAQRDETDKPVFPVGGVRVLAYPAAHFAVADGSGDFGFIYLQLRMGRGRSEWVQQRVGAALVASAKECLAVLLTRQAVGVTLQIDVGAEVFDGKLGNLHPLFK
ncbi:MAG: 5-carboxymethyl-2-hydroxymuconate isomerase [Rhodoferax sp.]|uniref:5-carboxymethyl-2-hydroxymuconate isomerase n=1 Tax=Rhodoferax sp. TaxID=50421 RepID=UPI00326723D2